MSVYKKLQQARIKLQSSELKKSGLNKFAGFQYFELGDFLPTVQTIFSELGLSSSIKFAADMAELTIVDTDSAESSIVFTCPVVVPTMKGCNEIQALGAMMTYIRRYLYVNALEIVEHDAIDAVSGQEGKGKGVHKPTNNQDYQPEGDELKFITGVLDTVIGLDTDYAAANKYLHSQNLDADQKTWVWDKLDSKTRSAIKKLNVKE
ncbi:MAG TPA: ERF family protein [Candidatus Paceibacterota bacterium]